MSLSQTTAISQHSNNTSYTISPSPPSPFRSTPPLSHSTSISSQISLPRPSTPPRGRARYPPNLARVPLHRRGTSNTYECLEDLLREAGYKETRIFTPEGEHDPDEHDPHSDRKPDGKRASVRGSVEAVVGFLAGLMPRATSRNSSLRPAPQANIHPNDIPPGSQSDVPQLRLDQAPSSLTQTQPYPRHPTRRAAALASSSSTTLTPASSSENLNLAPPSSSRLATPSTSSTARPQRRHRPNPLHLPYSPSAASLLATLHAHPRPGPSRVSPYLRHMASAPSMPRTSLTQNDSDEHDTPPLPRTWFENVARAVLFGGPGTHVGGPGTSTVPPGRRTSSTTGHLLSSPRRRAGGRNSRSMGVGASVGVSRGRISGTLSDHGLASHHHRTKHPAAAMLAPPPLCVRMQTARAGTTSGMVSRTAVVCRSAPASRAGSRVRGGGASWLKGESSVTAAAALMDVEGLEKRERGAKELKRERERGRERERAKARGRPKDDGVPSLARTRAEGDLWSRTAAGGRGGNRFLSGWGVGGDGHHYDEHGHDDYDDDDDNDDDDDDNGGHSSSEGELDLARMLVPPKRQNSIRSLRRHLHLHLQDASGQRQRQRQRKRGRGVLLTGRSGVGKPMWSDREDDASAEEEEGEVNDRVWGSVWGGGGGRRKRGRRGSGDEEDEEGYRRIAAGLLGVGGSGSGGMSVGRRRRAIPDVWAQWAAAAAGP